MNTGRIVFQGLTPSNSQMFEHQRINGFIQFTTSFQFPIVNQTNVITVDPRGSQFLPNIPSVPNVQQMNQNQQRIPERIVHTKGAGAFGVFEATHDISDICRAKVFNVGMKTRVLVRFSTCVDGSGSIDTIRKSNGFAVKMYTDEGIWDLVGSSLPVFLIRDPNVFSSLAQVQKRNPQTQLKDPNMFWDFLANHPQTIHHTLLVHSDRGIPDGFRFMHGYGSHTFKMVNNKNQFVWVKFHFRSDQKIRNLDSRTAKVIEGRQPDYATTDLFKAIETKNYPSWTLYIQVMTNEQAKKSSFDPFDLTKVFPQKEYPLRKVGKLTLNENPTNHFSQIEQAAFTPTHMPPGIEASPDKILQMRVSVYADAQLRRVGPNNQLISVNNPQTNKNFNTHTFQSNGSMQTGTFPTNILFREDDYFQARNFYKNVLDKQGRLNLISNIGESLARCTDKNIVHRALFSLGKVDDKLRQKLAEKLGF